MAYPHVVVDANVMAHALVRDLLLDADAEGVLRVRWTERILAEMRHVYLDKFGRGAAEIDALLAALRRHFPTAMIEGYEEREAEMTNDLGDRHVLAAAVHAGADIVTFNLKHFRPRDLARSVSGRYPRIASWYVSIAIVLALLRRSSAISRRNVTIDSRRLRTI